MPVTAHPCEAPTGMNQLSNHLAWMAAFSSLADFVRPLGRFFANHLVQLVAVCALVDFVKLLVELLGRTEDRRFSSDPSQVTAVIASRDGEVMLPGTIDDLLPQIPPERIIVVDDGSKDGTAEVARAKG